MPTQTKSDPITESVEAAAERVADLHEKSVASSKKAERGVPVLVREGRRRAGRHVREGHRSDARSSGSPASAASRPTRPASSPACTPTRCASSSPESVRMTAAANVAVIPPSLPIPPSPMNDHHFSYPVVVPLRGATISGHAAQSPAPIASPSATRPLQSPSATPPRFARRARRRLSQRDGDAVPDGAPLSSAAGRPRRGQGRRAHRLELRAARRARGHRAAGRRMTRPAPSGTTTWRTCGISSGSAGKRSARPAGGSGRVATTGGSYRTRNAGGVRARARPARAQRVPSRSLRARSERSPSASSGGRPRTASCRRRKNSLTSSRLIEPRGRYQCQMLLYSPSSARVRRRGSASGRTPCSMPRTRNVAHANSTSRIARASQRRASSSRGERPGHAHQSLFGDENAVAQHVLLAQVVRAAEHREQRSRGSRRARSSRGRTRCGRTRARPP